MRSSVVLPEPLSPKQSEKLALFYVERNGFEHGVLAEAFAYALQAQKALRLHWLAFTSFHISVYLARRGTSCQKTIWRW